MTRAVVKTAAGYIVSARAVADREQQMTQHNFYASGQGGLGSPVKGQFSSEQLIRCKMQKGAHNVLRTTAAAS